MQRWLIATILWTLAITRPSFGVELCDIKAIVLSIEKAVPPKTQFEKDSDFKQRATEEYKSSGINGSDIVCEVGAVADKPLIVEGFSLFSAKYDPEKQSVVYKADVFYGVQHNDTTDIGTYKASNGFGATAVIKESSSEIYGAQINLHNISAQFPLKASIAEKQWNDLVIAVRFNIASPELVYESRVSEPEFDSPKKQHLSFKSVKAKPTAILLVNKKSGEILGETAVKKTWIISSD